MRHCVYTDDNRAECKMGVADSEDAVVKWATRLPTGKEWKNFI